MSIQIDDARLRIIVDSRLWIPRAAQLLDPLILQGMREEFTHPNPAHETWASLHPRVRKFKPEPERTLQTWRDEPGGGISLPRGGLGRLTKFLAGLECLDFEVEDRRSRGSQPPWAPDEIKHSSTLFDFQEEMVRAALKHETCILRAPCGSGKTTVGIAIAARVGVSTLIVAPTTRIFAEWVKRLGDELGLAPDEIGWLGKGKKRIRPITVATVDTLRRRVAEVAPLFGCVIFDEVHRAPASSYYPVIDALPCEYRIGMSADERRKDKKHGINYDLFGDVAADIPQQRLIDAKFVIAVDVLLVPTNFEAEWYRTLPDDQKRRPDLYNRLLEQMVRDAGRTSLAVALAVQEMAYRPTLVFSHRVEHCQRMCAGIAELGRGVHSAGLILGEEVYKVESDETVLGLESGTHRCGVGTYQSIGTGFNLQGVESGVAVTPILANRQNFGQIRDRLCRVDRRPGATKTSATIYVLWDRKVFGDRPLRNALAWCAGRVMVVDDHGLVDGRAYLRRGDDYSLTEG